MANEFLDPNKKIGLTKYGKTVAEIRPASPPKVTPPLWGYARAGEPGVEGDSAFKAQPGVLGAHGDGGDGVLGVSDTGVAVHGRGGQWAGLFEGNVQVTGDVEVQGTLTALIDVVCGADCAEDFDIAGDTTVEPGTVMVLGHEGELSESREAYDKRVAGVISGA